MKPYLRVKGFELYEQIDEDGQLIDVSLKKHTQLVKGKDNFFFMYANILGIYHKLKSTDVKVLSIIMLKYLTEDGAFPNAKSIREKIANACNISVPAVEKSVKSLLDNGVFFKKERGLYDINPLYVWKGSSGLRKEKLKLQLEIEMDSAE